jgi:hypothetical protein
MAINLDCPRCKTRLRVPNKKAGGYVNCPHCKGRFWVDKAAPSDDAQADAVTIAPPPVAAPPSPPAAPLAAAIPPRAPRPSATVDMQPPLAVPPALADKPNKPKPDVPAVTTAPCAPPTMAAPPVAAATSATAPPVQSPGRKVARFISAEAAQSTLQLAADGKLPELHLSDGDQKEEKEKKSSALSPLALIGILFGSVLLTIVIIMAGDTSSSGNTEAQTKAAWAQIEADYFSDPAGSELKPYNRMLREAKRAYQSQDRKTERQLFNKILDMLRAERDANEKGLTGTRQRDKILEQNLTTLLQGINQE